MQAKIKHLFGGSLLLNAIHLILSTGVLSGFGFLFWVISTRLVSAPEIGIATTMISVMGIISIFSLLGFDSALVRFLSNSDNKNAVLNTSLILVGGVALVLSAIFVIFINHISPQLYFIRENIIISVSFILFCVATSINILTDAVFLSYRQTRYTLAINSIFSFVKMILPLFFFRYGAFGIFLSAAVGQSIGFIVSIVVMIWKFDYEPKFIIDKEIISKVWRFSLGNYFAGAFNLLPVALLPLIITNRIGLKESAYFYMVMMIINLLYAVPQAVTRSLFAEGSHNEDNFAKDTRKSFIIIACLLVPAIVVLVLFGNKLLLVFGKSYAENGLFLSIMSLSALLISVNSLFNSYFRIKKNMKALLISSSMYAISIVVLTYLLVSKGLLGIGIAWILGTAISTITSFAIYRFYYARNDHKVLSHLPYWRGFDDRLGEFTPVFMSKLYFIKSFILNGFKSKKVIFYPEKPVGVHTAYQIVTSLGYRITSNPKADAVAAFVFEDTTLRTPDPAIEDLNKKYKLINYRCNDISKERVEEVFQNAFGYGTFVDPETLNGTCVRKSSNNALHDGKIVKCPTKKEAGYIYQKFIDTRNGDLVTDHRLIIMNGKIAFVIKRYKNINDPFDNTFGADVTETKDDLSQNEIEKVERFCSEFGLDYGEIDSLRDNEDNRLYLVDANNTPSGPRAGRTLNRANYNALNKKLSDAFVAAFLN